MLVSSWILLLVSLGYAALLFGVAWWGDRRPLYPERPWLRPAVYSLALAVYCSSWTFYGAVGSAVRNGIGYLPIYLGPLLLLLFGWRIIERLALIARAENTVSHRRFHLLALRPFAPPGRVGGGDRTDRHRSVPGAAIQSGGDEPGSADRA